ncbi:MAG: hypothetical protein ABIO36_02410 [Pyrinomonadaceae bacterium]
MFEQSLYETKRVATPLEPGDLFHNYELRNWEMSPRVYKILAAAASANLLALLVFAQTSLLTTKGCDSPLVDRVCQVLDTVYVGSKLFGTDREYVDAVYDKTELGDADITFVDVSGETPPLSYPEGYFQVANPVEYQASLDAANNPAMPPGFPNFQGGFPVTTPSTGGSLIDTPPVTPKVNPKVIDGNLPTFGGMTGTSNPTRGRRKFGRGGRITPPTTDVDADDTASADPKPTATPAPTPMSSDAVTAVEINKKPLTDFADDVSAKWEAKDIDLNKDFSLVLNAFITADGKLDRAKSKFDSKKTVGDPKMIDVGKAALEALGDSGYLTYLKLAGVDQLTATLTQDDQHITVVITSTQKTPERASSISSIVSSAIVFGKVKAENPSDERTLLDGAKVTSDGKNFILNFAIPKPVAQEMINRKLKEAQAKKAQQPKPNGNAITKPVDNTGK